MQDLPPVLSASVKACCCRWTHAHVVCIQIPFFRIYKYIHIYFYKYDTARQQHPSGKQSCIKQTEVGTSSSVIISFYFTEHFQAVCSAAVSDTAQEHLAPRGVGNWRYDGAVHGWVTYLDVCFVVWTSTWIWKTCSFTAEWEGKLVQRSFSNQGIQSRIPPEQKLRQPLHESGARGTPRPYRAKGGDDSYITTMVVI